MTDTTTTIPTLIRYRDLAPRFGIDWTRQHVARRVRAGTFPRPVKLSKRTVCWRVADIAGWIEAHATGTPDE